MILLEGHQTMVGDGDAVRIASEIMNHVLRSAERRLGVDDPLACKELAQELAQAFGSSKLLKLAMELELAL